MPAHRRSAPGNHHHPRRGRGLIAPLLALAVGLVTTAGLLVTTRTPVAPDGSLVGGLDASEGMAGAAGAEEPPWAATTPDPDLGSDPQSAEVGAVSATAVSIPDIGVDSTLVPLGVDATGALVPPERYDVAGWFAAGPLPGTVGPAVIAGHVDSRAGPGVFYRLEEMVVGQIVTVAVSDGSSVRFAVTAVGQYPKTDFPTELVYGPTPGRELRLITCGGNFDPSRRSYLDNIVVYATALP